MTTTIISTETDPAAVIARLTQAADRVRGQDEAPLREARERLSPTLARAHELLTEYEALERRIGRDLGQWARALARPELARLERIGTPLRNAIQYTKQARETLAAGPEMLQRAIEAGRRLTLDGVKGGVVAVIEAEVRVAEGNLRAIPLDYERAQANIATLGARLGDDLAARVLLSPPPPAPGRETVAEHGASPFAD